MIVGFPNTLQEFQVCKRVPKNDQISYSHFIGRLIETRAPILLKPGDKVLIELRTGQVQMVHRRGIVIWRSGCWN